MIVFFNGEFKDDKDVCISIYDGGFLMGHGVYEALRTFKGEIRFLEEHVDRFFESALAMGLHMPYAKERVVEFTNDLVKKRFEEIGSRDKDLRIRHQLTSGKDSVRTGEIKDFTFLITVSEFTYDIDESVKVVTFDIERTMPCIKSTSMIANILCKKYAMENGAYESLMVNRDGFVTEGTFTNLFVVKDDVLKTPKEGMLYGITRDSILKIARGEMSVRECKIRKAELYVADEIFLTNSIMGVIPVTHVDGRPVGGGEIGKRTKEIKRLYDESVG